jgi:fumarylacetoacetate (FAA) hydrolase family protein
MFNSHLPQDAHQALLVGRLWVPGAGAHVVAVTPQNVFDLSDLANTCSALLDLPDVATQIHDFVNSGLAPALCGTDQALGNSLQTVRNPDAPWFMAPCDLQAVKAAGVTFVASMLERVIEEQARGDASRAEAVRQAVVAVIGDNLRSVVPGSAQAAQLKQVLLAQGMWSQYLEVGIGPDAEIFTKSQPMSAVGSGAWVGIHPASQ